MFAKAFLQNAHKIYIEGDWKGVKNRETTSWKRWRGSAKLLQSCWFICGFVTSFKLHIFYIMIFSRKWNCFWKIKTSSCSDVESEPEQTAEHIGFKGQMSEAMVGSQSLNGDFYPFLFLPVRLPWGLGGSTMWCRPHYQRFVVWVSGAERPPQWFHHQGWVLWNSWGFISSTFVFPKCCCRLFFFFFFQFTQPDSTPNLSTTFIVSSCFSARGISLGWSG